MRAIINRKDFQKSLIALRFKSCWQTDYVHFNGGYIYTFDDERVNMLPYPLKYSGAVHLKHLIASLGGKEESVELIWNARKSKSGKGCLTVVNGSQTAELTGQPLDTDVFDVHAGKEVKWCKLSNDFFDGIEMLEKTVSRDAPNFQLSSIHCTPKYFEAASASQIYRAYHSLPANFEFLIRYGVLKGIRKGADQIARTQQHCYFRYDTGLVVAIRIFNEPYLKSVAKKIEQERAGCSVRLPAELRKAIEKAKIFTEDQQVFACVINDGMCTITAKNANGEYTASAKIDYAGDEVSFTIRAKVLIDVLKFDQECIIADDCIKVENDRFVFLSGIARI